MLEAEIQHSYSLACIRLVLVKFIDGLLAIWAQTSIFLLRCEQSQARIHFIQILMHAQRGYTSVKNFQYPTFKCFEERPARDRCQNENLIVLLVGYLNLLWQSREILMFF